MAAMDGRTQRSLIGAPALVAAAALCHASRAEVINVPGDYPTIQASIAASADGDEIIVAPGTYHEAIQFLGKEVTLRSALGPEVTRIDATGLGLSAVRFVNSEGPAAVLDGFTITGGTGTPESPETTSGGGALIGFSSPTITNCTFTLNSATFGAGLSASYSEATLIDCRFVANTGNLAGGARTLEGAVEFRGCAFIGNTATAVGGGLFIWGGATLTDCIMQAIPTAA